jgi:hypothetical protein
MKNSYHFIWLLKYAGPQSLDTKQACHYTPQGRRDVNMQRFKKFPQFSGIIYSFFLSAIMRSPEGKTVNKEMYTKILHHIRDAVRKKCLKIGEPTVGFSFVTMLEHTGQFWPKIF